LPAAEGGWVAHGAAVDIALLALAHKLGTSPAAAEAELPK
jgi:hypothetical protein